MAPGTAVDQLNVSPRPNHPYLDLFVSIFVGKPPNFLHPPTTDSVRVKSQVEQPLPTCPHRPSVSAKNFANPLCKLEHGCKSLGDQVRDHPVGPSQNLVRETRLKHPTHTHCHFEWSGRNIDWRAEL